MNIIWFSGRKMADLSSTTQKSLGSGLVERGHNLIFVNPDVAGTHKMYPWSHQSIIASQIPGLKSITLARKMNKWLCENLQEENTVVILDWRIAGQLTKTLQKHKIPWLLMDRSPPANRGFLAKLQWPQWKRSWKKAKKGTVVSLEHKNFIVNKCKISSDNIHVIPAGVNLDLFSKSEKKGKLKLLYHGNLDLNRNILELPQILIHLEKAGVDVEMHLIGHGDAFKALSKLNLPNLKLSGPMNQRELASMISEFDIGFLPMPNSGVWNIASPLKRSEYSGSGMVIIGIDHAGHRFSEDLDWVLLFEESKFVSGAVDFCKNIKRKDLSVLQNKSRTYAEDHLSWDQSIDTLNRLIHSVVD